MLVTDSAFIALRISLKCLMSLCGLAMAQLMILPVFNCKVRLVPVESAIVAIRVLRCWVSRIVPSFMVFDVLTIRMVLFVLMLFRAARQRYVAALLNRTVVVLLREIVLGPGMTWLVVISISRVRVFTWALYTLSIVLFGRIFTVLVLIVAIIFENATFSIR